MALLRHLALALSVVVIARSAAWRLGKNIEWSAGQRGVCIYLALAYVCVVGCKPSGTFVVYASHTFMCAVRLR